MKKTWLSVMVILLTSICAAQPNQAWQGKKCAVVITYDDAIDQHLDNAIPVLDSLGLINVADHIRKWQANEKDKK